MESLVSAFKIICDNLEAVRIPKGIHNFSCVCAGDFNERALFTHIVHTEGIVNVNGHSLIALSLLFVSFSPHNRLAESQHQTGNGQAACQKDKEFFQPGLGFAFLLQFPEKPNIAEIDFFVFTEIKEVDDDRNGNRR
jgi:hypothetical protein